MASIGIAVRPSRLKAMRWPIICSVLLCTGAFTLAAFMEAPEYRTAVLVAPASSDRAILGLLGRTSGEFGAPTSMAGLSLQETRALTAEAIAVLKSRRFSEEFIGDENLMPELFRRQWDAGSRHWKASQADPPTLARAARLFNERIISISRDPQNGLLTLQIQWQDRFEAAAWANKMIERLNTEMKGRSLANARASQDLLERELVDAADVGERNAITRLIGTRMRQRALFDAMPEFAFRVIDAATPPDEDDPARPRRALMILAGPIVGGLCGCALVILRIRNPEFRDRRNVV